MGVLIPGGVKLGLYLFELQITLGPLLRSFILEAGSSDIKHFFADLFILISGVILLGNYLFRLIHKLANLLLFNLVDLLVRHVSGRCRSLTITAERPYLSNTLDFLQLVFRILVIGLASWDATLRLALDQAIEDHLTLSYLLVCLLLLSRLHSFVLYIFVKWQLDFYFNIIFYLFKDSS